MSSELENNMYYMYMYMYIGIHKGIKTTVMAQWIIFWTFNSKVLDSIPF